MANGKVIHLPVQRINNSSVAIPLILAALLGILVGLASSISSPFLVPVAIAALVFVLVARRDLYTGIALGMLAVSLISTRSESESAVPLDAATITIFLLLIVWLISEKRPTLKEIGGPIAYGSILFLFVGLLSILANKPTLGMFAVWIRFFSYFLLIFIASRISWDTVKLESVFIALIIAGGIASLIGFYQYIFLPEMSIGLAGIEKEITARVAGTYENPNFFGEFLVFTIPIAIALTICAQNWWRRFASLAIGLIMLIALFLTYTRGSWLGLLVGIMIFSMLTYRRLFWSFLALSAVAVVSVSSISSRLKGMFDITKGTAGFRLKLWQIVFGIIKEQPIFGAGIGNYASAFTNYIFAHPEKSIGWVIYGAHNSYLRIAAEMGLAGLFSFLAVLALCCQVGFANSKIITDKKDKIFNAAILSSMVAFIINSATSNSFFHPRAVFFFWIYAGILLGFMKKYSSGAKMRLPNEHKR